MGVSTILPAARQERRKTFCDCARSTATLFKLRSSDIRTREESLLHGLYLGNAHYSRVAVTQVMVATGRNSIVKLRYILTFVLNFVDSLQIS